MTALDDLNDRSFEKHIANLRSREHAQGELIQVNIHPMWFTGSEAEVHRNFSDYIAILRNQDDAIDSHINQIKAAGNMSAAGMI